MALRRKAGRRHFSGLLVVLTSITGCATWQPVEPRDQSLPARIRIVTMSQQQIELKDPVLQGDSVIWGTAVDERMPVRVAMRDVAVVLGRFHEAPSTLLFVGAAVLLMTWAISMMPYT